VNPPSWIYPSVVHWAIAVNHAMQRLLTAVIYMTSVQVGCVTTIRDYKLEVCALEEYLHICAHFPCKKPLSFSEKLEDKINLKSELDKNNTLCLFILPRLT